MNLSARDVRGWYGQTQVLFGIDLDVGDHEIVGIFGHNGAGKSTLLRVFAGLHRRATYELTLGDRRLTHEQPHLIARRGLMFVREGANVFEGLTVHEHLALGQRLGRMGGRGSTDLAEIFEWIPILGEFRKRLGSQLSGGQRQLLALGMAFAANPLCLLLDEPSTGLAPAALEALFTALKTFSAKGVPLLVTEQNPTWLSQIAHRAYLLELGRIVAEGEPRALLGAGEHLPLKPAALLQ